MISRIQDFKEITLQFTGFYFVNLMINSTIEIAFLFTTSSVCIESTCVVLEQNISYLTLTSIISTRYSLQLTSLIIAVSSRVVSLTMKRENYRP